MLLKSSDGGRFLLGKAALTLSPKTVTSVSVAHVSGQLVVNYKLTLAAGKSFDAVADTNFHQEIALVLQSVVISASLVQPDQDVFTSVEGNGELAGNFSESEAWKIAASM